MPRTEIYRHDDDVSVVTTATDERDFIESFAVALGKLIHEIGRTPNETDFTQDYQEWMARLEYDHQKALAAGFEILAKIRGYKAPTVQERRVLAAGRWPHPSEKYIAHGGEWDGNGNSD